jgi:hypothetical protein
MIAAPRPCDVRNMIVHLKDMILRFKSATRQWVGVLSRCAGFSAR